MPHRLRHYGLLALEHWKKFRPKMYAELKKSGDLYPVLLELQEKVSDLVSDLILEKGYQHHEAEELALPLILFPSEDDEPNLAESNSPALSNLPPPVITASRKVIPLRKAAKRKQTSRKKVR